MNITKQRTIFYFLFLIPLFLLVFEIRTTLIDTRRMSKELFLLNMQRASNQRTILGLQTRILHYVEGHTDDDTAIACPLCFDNLMMEKYDHELIKKFLREQNQ
jgi:hypothetical protein